MQLAPIEIIEAVFGGEIDPGVYCKEILVVIEKIAEDRLSPLDPGTVGCTFQKGSEIEQPFPPVEEVRLLKRGCIDRAYKRAVAGGIAIEIVIERLKINHSFFVPSEILNIGLQHRLVVRIKKFEAVAVESHQSYLCGQP